MVAFMAGAQARATKLLSFKNLILLGDSLTDTGNVLVAPLTNILDDNGFFSHNPSTGEPFKRPQHPLNERCYPTILANKHNNGAGWSEYFIDIAHQEGSTKQTSVVPSMFLHARKECQASYKKAGRNSVAVNYAWASAVTAGICRDYDRECLERQLRPFRGHQEMDRE